MGTVLPLSLVQVFLESAPDAMLVVASDGKIVLINSQVELLFGYKRSELIGMEMERLMPVRYREAHADHRLGYFTHPRVRLMGTGLALFGLRKDGTEFPVDISLSPIDTDHGVMSISAVRDLTELRRAEEEREKLVQAQEAIRARDDFLSVASHELKTPLTLLQLQVDSLRTYFRNPNNPVTEKLSGKLDVVRRSVHRLNMLINQLLDLSRINAGRMTLEREQMDLSELVRTVARQLQDESASAGSLLTIRANEPVVGWWDPLKIEQVITNLLSNAIKYGNGKPIEANVRGINGTKAVLEVRDEGIGIEAKDQARIFERFERIVSERHYRGFGLGLWIVRQIVEMHGGSIRVSSAPGAGSTFTVELPTSHQ